MAEIKQIVFDYREVVTALLRKENIHEGIWMLYIEFGLAAINAPIVDAKDEMPSEDGNPLERLMPVAMIPLKRIGIQRTEALSSLAVDAAVVNPKSSGKKG